jgi:hypothetical protein
MKKWIGLSLIFTVYIAAIPPILESEALLLNIPVDYKYEKGLFNYGAQITTFASYYEMDLLMHYAVTDKIRTGLYVLDSNYFAGHFHMHLSEYEGFRFGSGLIHLPDTRTIGDTIDGEETPNFSPYIMTTKKFKRVDIHAGVGSNQFVQSGTATGNVALDGFFGGVVVKFDKINALLEYDGQSLNIGARLLINKSTYFEISARDITEEQSYDDNERPLLTFGFKVQDTLFEKPVHKEIRLDREITSYKELELDTRILKKSLEFELNEIKEEHDALSDALKRLEEAMRQDVRFLYKEDKEDKEMLRRHYVNVNQEIGEKVIKYYYDSFEYFYKKDYYKSIEVLQQAIILDPYMPQLYSRLGSIYFELDLPNEALEAWNHALKLDPNNKELRRLISNL